MELRLVLGLAGDTDFTPAARSGLEEAMRRLAADLGSRFPGARWMLLTSGSGESVQAVRRAAEESGLVSAASPPGSGARFVADASHLLLTLGCDGALGPLVAARLGGRPARDMVEGISLDPATRGPVVQLEPAVPEWTTTWSNPDEPERKKKKRKPSHERVWRNVEAFNRDARRAGNVTRTENLLGEAGKDLPSAPRALLEAYETADALAQIYQERTQRVLWALLILAVFATLLLQVGALTWIDRKVSGALYVASLAGAWIVYLWSKKRALRSKHLDYRALAEGLRVQLFWRLAGLPDYAADRYLRKQRSELDWIRHALYSLDLGPGEPARAIPLQLVQEKWLEDQARYYANAARDDTAADGRVRRLTGAFFVVALALAFLKPFLNSSHPLVVLIGLLPLTAAFVKWWSERRAFGPLARQYERMAGLFSTAADQAREALAAGRTDDVRAILREAGIEALTENGDWLLLHRERQIRVPGA